MIIARITKVFTRGPLRGQTIEENMPFVTLRLAEDWFEGVNSQHRRGYVDYHVDDMEIIGYGKK